ncbi:glutamate ABC transporter substrate-binding protein [Mariniluteicoccus endophyticus]
MIPRHLRTLAVLGCALALSACSAGYSPTPMPTRRPTAAADPADPGNCNNPAQSYDPVPPGPPLAGTTMARLADRGRLVVGVSSDAMPLAYRNAVNGDLEGFEIDLARTLARAMFNDESKLELRVINAGDVRRAIDDGDVDVAIRQVGMTCNGWQNMKFSAPYAVVPIKVLGRATGVPGKDELRKHRICSAAGSHASMVLGRGDTRVTAATDALCMVQFQRGEVDAVAGTAPAMAGLARQDPYAKVSDYDLGTSSLAVAVRADRADLAAWVNQVLAGWSGGAWAESWNRWVRPYVGDAAPPKPAYGRPVR